MNETCSELNTLELKAKAVKGAFIKIIANFIGFLCHAIGVVVLARLLTPEDFGLVVMVTTFSVWLMNFGVNGFTEYIIQKQHFNDNEISLIFWLHLFLATTLAFGFTFFGLFLVKFYVEPSLWGISAAMSTSLIFNALLTTHLSILKREMKFVSIAIVELVSVILSVVFAIAIAMNGMAYWAIVTRQLTIHIVIMVAVWILCPFRPDFPRNPLSVLPALKYAIQVYFNFSLGYLMKTLDKILLGKFHGSKPLGYYDRAYHLFSIPENNLLFPLHNIALATLSRLINDKKRFSSYYKKAISIIAFIGFLTTIVLTLSSHEIVLLLLGPQWTEAGKILMAFAPGIAATLVYNTHSWLHLSLGTPDRWLRWNLMAAVITTIFFVLAAPFGAVAMAIAGSVKAYVLVLPGLWYAGRPIQLGIGDMLSPVWAYFTSAICVSVSWLFLSAYWPPLNDLIIGLSPLNRIIIISSITSFLYVVLVIIQQGDLRSIREILSLIPIIFSQQVEWKSL